MERYEVRQISPLTWGIYDHEEDEIILETTRNGVEVYADVLFRSMSMFNVGEKINVGVADHNCVRL